MNVCEKFCLDRNSAVLLVVDIQEKLCKAMAPETLEQLTGNVSTLLETAKELNIPVVATEQYTRGLGETLPDIREKLPETAIEKMSFSCCGEETFLSRLKNMQRRQVIVTGMETHICVLQTALELLAQGYHVHVVSDAVISRKKRNWELGLNMAASAGAVITSTEAAMFQLLKVAGTDEFKKLSKLVR
ncbi:MAG TPA: hydrolase [Geobacteraceae bacterium]|nr:hydrolase [Geobacteraceae bacterium]